MAKTKKAAISVTMLNRMDLVLGVVDKALKRKVTAMGHTVRDKLLMEVLVGERTGEWYPIPGTKKMYRASKRGEAPATRLGDLRRSYRVGSVQGMSPDFHVLVGSPLKYAAELEAEMDRKHLEPAVRLAQPDIEAIMRGDWGI